MNVECEIYHYAGSNWRQRNSIKRFKGKFGNHARKTFSRFTTKHNYTWSITYNTGGTAVLNLKPERWIKQQQQQ